MSKKTIIIWVILFGGGFGCGYWLDEWANQQSFREKYIRSLGWAISEGILTVNEDRMDELGKLENAEVQE